MANLTDHLRFAHALSSNQENLDKSLPLIWLFLMRNLDHVFMLMDHIDRPHSGL
jgi:hypothetical protein